MPATGPLWKQLEAEAASQAARMGFSGNTPSYNAFFHVYASARLLQLKGEAGALIRGSGLELKNHLKYWTRTIRPTLTNAATKHGALDQNRAAGLAYGKPPTSVRSRHEGFRLSTAGSFELRHRQNPLR